MSPEQDHPEEHQKIIEAHQKAAHFFEHAFAAHAKKHAEEAALHHSHEHGDKEPLHAHEQRGS